MPTEPRRWRGAIVGVGGVAEQSHLPAFRDAAVAERLTISCAVDPAPAAAERAGGLPLVPGVDRLDTSRLDFLDVTTPTATHPLLARWALERGLHVLCEKPVATTRAEALALVSLAESRGRALVPCHQQRYNPVWRRVREWLSGGALGRWHLAEIAVYRTGADRGATGAGDAPWRTRVTDGGGVLADHGTHLLYTLLDLGGMPLRLQAWTARLAHRAYEVEDTAQVRLDFDEARAGTLFVTWAARRRETRVRIVGERGTITWVDGALTLERDGVEEAYDLARALDKAAYVSWFAELFATVG